MPSLSFITSRANSGTIHGISKAMEINGQIQNIRELYLYTGTIATLENINLCTLFIYCGRNRFDQSVMISNGTANSELRNRSGFICQSDDGEHDADHKERQSNT